MDKALQIFIAAVVTVALAALIVGGVWLMKSRYDTGIIDGARNESNAVLKNTTDIANETMAVETVADAVVVTNQREELRSASIDRPDGLTARQRRGCVILRQQGTDLARDPTCRRLAR